MLVSALRCVIIAVIVPAQISTSITMDRTCVPRIGHKSDSQNIPGEFHGGSHGETISNFVLGHLGSRINY